MFTGKIGNQDLDTRISEFLAWGCMSRDTMKAVATTSCGWTSAQERNGDIVEVWQPH